MCISILRNPVAAIMGAKKKRSMNKSWLALFEAAILFGLASGVVIMRGSLSGISYQIAAVSGLSVFVVMFVLGAVLGYVLKIIATTLGGSGRYFEGLTAVSYSLIPISAALFISSILTFIPGGIILSAIVVAVGFASGISLLYRGVKELFRTDMVTALVAVSVLIIVILVASSVAFGLSTLTRLGGLIAVR